MRPGGRVDRSDLGRAQLAKLKRHNAARVRLVGEYRRRLRDLPGWVMPFSGYTGESACHLATVLAPDRATRDRAVEHLRSAGIQTSLHYPCVADFSVFGGQPKAERLENTREYAERTITLPLFPAMTVAQVEEVCGVLGEGAARDYPRPEAGAAISSNTRV